MDLAIFGGSFDPVHNGHIMLAKSAVSCGYADKVIFMPTAVQPFKQDRTPAPAHDRLEMLRIATKGCGYFEISDFEISHPERISYTIDTLRAMRRLYPQDHIYLLMGADSLMNLEKWKESREIMTDYSILLGKRPGIFYDDLEEKKNELERKYGADIVILDNRLVDVSSTYVRDETSKSVTDYYEVPEEVGNYIIEKRLYRKMHKR